MKRDVALLRQALAHLEQRCGCSASHGCTPGRPRTSAECDAGLEHARRALMPNLLDLVRVAVAEPPKKTCTKLVLRKGAFDHCGSEEVVGEREETAWCAAHVAEPGVAE